MRLGQLARKLSVRPSQIVDLLAKNQQYFDEGSNAKLNDDLVKHIALHFAPERLAELMTAQTQEEEEIQSKPEVEVIKKEELEKVEPQPEPVAESHTEDGVESETIRAPKVELAGLKVLGKIELPKPRKKEESVAEISPETEQKPRREHKDKRRNPVERTEKNWRNPIAQQREAEAREKEERRKKALEEEKERKRINYLSKLKATQPVKAARIYEEPEEQKEIKVEKQPRTWVGKFLKWLNT